VERLWGCIRPKGCPTGYGCLKRFFKIGCRSYAQALPARGTLWPAAALPGRRTDPTLICPARPAVELPARCRIAGRVSAAAAGCNPDRRLPASAVNCSASQTGWHQNGRPPPLMDFERRLQHGPRAGAPRSLDKQNRCCRITSKGARCCCSSPPLRAMNETASQRRPRCL